MTPFSWSLVLLLLLLAAAPTWGQSQIFALNLFYNLYKILTLFGFHSHTSTGIIEGIMDAVDNNILCMPVSERQSRNYIKSLKLYFYYGPTPKDSHAVPLSKASDLLNYTRWKKDLPVTMFVFGWGGGVSTNATMEVVQGYHSNGQHNLVVADWHKPGQASYGEATTMVPRVGKALGAALQALLDAGAPPGQIVGHSLGAHVAGYVARSLRNKPNFFAALDPAGPLFSPTMYKCQEGMSSTDAKYVVVLHTDWNRRGVNEICGHVDFMPNAGHGLQPGCPIYDMQSDHSCSHNRAAYIWREAISSNGSILGRSCGSWDEFKSGMCSQNSVLSLTGTTEEYGVYFLTTNDRVPYSKGMQGV